MDEGSWTDHGATGISSSSSKSYNAIDANVFNDDGTYYLTFGSFWQDIFQAPLNSAATKAASSSYNIALDPSGDHAVEGAYLYKSGDYYYLFYSAGACCGYDTSRPATGDEYNIKVCRSSSATGDFVCGPAIYLKHQLTELQVDATGTACTAGGGTVVLESHDNVYGPGGQYVSCFLYPFNNILKLTSHRGVFTDPDLGPVLYYHYVDTTIGYADNQKLFGWNAIDFSSGWPVV